MTECRRIYFGLEVVELRGTRVVRKADIQRLPFYEFSEDSAAGSSSLAGKDGPTEFVYLHDWVTFAELFIQTGRHRYVPDPK
ncbi:hypothetical protein ABQJ54_14280 [Rhodanobacter sp. Si-c]|uniref:Uncharacterized protein n=1 Tax=Rhodanobacter lycopersici TaxID=3162487 RepID=A0ABV3QHJ1_9GAMM